MKKDVTKMTFSVEDVIEFLTGFINDERYKAIKPPRFSFEEIMFLTRLIVRKEKDSVLIATMQFVSDRAIIGSHVLNTSSLRRTAFFRHYVNNMGNASKAAILAGYSPKSAKQQGYRMLKWIQAKNS